MIGQWLTELMGLPLTDALERLRDKGIEPKIIRVSGWREAAEGTERVIRVSEDAAYITVARFPDEVKRGGGS